MTRRTAAIQPSVSITSYSADTTRPPELRMHGDRLFRMDRIEYNTVDALGCKRCAQREPTGSSKSPTEHPCMLQPFRGDVLSGPFCGSCALSRAGLGRVLLGSGKVCFALTWCSQASGAELVKGWPIHSVCKRTAWPRENSAEFAERRCRIPGHEVKRIQEVPAESGSLSMGFEWLQALTQSSEGDGKATSKARPFGAAPRPEFPIGVQEK